MLLSYIVYVKTKREPKKNPMPYILLLMSLHIMWWDARKEDRFLKKNSLFATILYYYLAASNFFWSQSHAIGSYSGVSSRTNTPNPYNQHQQQQPIRNVGDECIGTSLQQNTLAPEAAHRPSLPGTTTDSTKTPIVSSVQCITSDVSTKTLQPCDECGATIV